MKEYDKILNLIYSNEVVMETLKELFMEEAERKRPKLTGQDDEVLGQEYRAYEKAKEIIEDTFITLKMMHPDRSSTNGVKYK